MSTKKRNTLKRLSSSVMLSKVLVVPLDIIIRAEKSEKSSKPKTDYNA